MENTLYYSGTLSPIVPGVKPVDLKINTFIREGVEEPVYGASILIDHDGGPYPINISKFNNILTQSFSFMYFRNDVTTDWNLSGDVTIVLDRSSLDAQIISKRIGVLGTVKFTQSNDLFLPKRSGFTGTWSGTVELNSGSKFMFINLQNGGPCSTNSLLSDFEWTPGKLATVRIGSHALDIHWVEIDYWRRVVTLRTPHSEEQRRHSIDLKFTLSDDETGISGIIKNSITGKRSPFELKLEQ